MLFREYVVFAGVENIGVELLGMGVEKVGAEVLGMGSGETRVFFIPWDDFVASFFCCPQKEYTSASVIP